MDNIYIALWRELVFKKNLTIENSYIYDDRFECDMFSVTEAGYQTEYEVKKTKSDFKADFKKSYRHRRKTVNKHDLIQSGKTGLKHFYFVVPKGLLSVDDVPDYCGIIEVTEHGIGYTTIDYLRKAPILPNAEKISKSKELYILNKFKFRYYKSIIKQVN